MLSVIVFYRCKGRCNRETYQCVGVVEEQYKQPAIDRIKNELQLSDEEFEQQFDYEKMPFNKLAL